MGSPCYTYKNAFTVPVSRPSQPFSGSAGKIRNLPSTAGFPPTKPQVADGQSSCLVGNPPFFPALPKFDPIDPKSCSSALQEDLNLAKQNYKIWGSRTIAFASSR